MSTQTLIVDARFRGPPDSGNGGYVSGRIAAPIAGVARVTLRRPVPLGRPLSLLASADGVTVRDRDVLVAEGVPTSVRIEVPDAVGYEDARAASRRYSGFVRHAFAGCFVCGPERGEGDGLRIFPGPVAGREVVAAPWTPGAGLADGDGSIRPEFVWAALDCPGAFATGYPATKMVLGRLAASLARPPRVGERCVVIGWPQGAEGRKREAGTAVLSEDREVLATAEATWITIED